MNPLILKQSSYSYFLQNEFIVTFDTFHFNLLTNVWSKNAGLAVICRQLIPAELQHNYQGIHFPKDVEFYFYLLSRANFSVMQITIFY